MLAQETERVLRERKWSLRRAELQTQVNYSTIYNMKLGRNVDPEHLVSFARAIGEDPDYWLAVAGKPFRIVSDADANQASINAVLPGGTPYPLSTGDIIYVWRGDTEPEATARLVEEVIAAKRNKPPGDKTPEQMKADSSK